MLDATTPRRSRRTVVAFFLLGLFNNLTFVINSAAAPAILPGAVGVVYIINCVPGLLVKLTAPFWWHWFSYRTKVLFVGGCFLGNMTLTNPGFAFSTPLQLLGVGIGELGSGLGEATVLALSQFYPSPKHQLSGWSSGTGLAGVFGYLLSMFALPLLSSWARLGLALVVIACYWSAPTAPATAPSHSHSHRPQPPPPERGCAREVPRQRPKSCCCCCC